MTAGLRSAVAGLLSLACAEEQARLAASVAERPAAPPPTGTRASRETPSSP